VSTDSESATLVTTFETVDRVESYTRGVPALGGERGGRPVSEERRRSRGRRSGT
jgi:hypothetical protein